MIDLRVGVEIMVLYIGIYLIFRLLRGTRGAGILNGLIVVMTVIVLALTGIAYALDSNRLFLVQAKIVQYAIFAGLIVFQPELRRVLVKFGALPVFRRFVEEEHGGVVNVLLKTAGILSNARTGALIAVQRDNDLGAFIEGGTKIDAPVSVDLLCTIFYNGTPLHDGAVIIQGDRIAAAGSLLPLSDDPQKTVGLGTRHRAAIGLTEETDAFVIVVSEETGRISYSAEGKLITGLSLEELREVLTTGHTRKEAVPA